MAGEIFKLNFVTNGEGIIDIQEPVGFNSIPFTLKQDDNRLGRDVFFGGDNENKFEFYRVLTHEIDLLFYYYETFGWESEVKLIIEKDGIDTIIGDLDFQNAETDLIEYFKCAVVQDSGQALLKKREDITVDLFSDETIDEEYIDPLVTKKILIRSKPTVQTSVWEVSESYEKTMNVDANFGVSDTEYFVLNPARNLVESEIDDSLTFLSLSRSVETLGTAKAIKEHDFIIVDAQNNLKDITITVDNLDLSMIAYKLGGGSAYADYELELRYGSEWDSANIVKFFNGRLRDGDAYENKDSYSHHIPFLNREDKIWLYYYFKLRDSGTLSVSFSVDLVVNSMDVSVKATSVAYNTVVPSVSLKEATTQVVKSISELNTEFPITDIGAELENQRLVSGNLLRNLSDNFEITFKDIVDWMPEIYAGYESNEENVFFGVYKDFYQNNEIDYFDDVRSDSYKKYFNERYAINEFNYEYKKYQSQKEEEVDNTFYIVHGETQWTVQNKGVENTKDVSVGFVRDSFYIDEQRRKSLELTDETSTQDDDTIFILDAKELEEDETFKETDYLQHVYNEDTGYIKISNTGDFSFYLLGIEVGSSFNILGDDANAGNYEVMEASDRYILINNGSGTSGNNGDRDTYFEYTISKESVPYVTWSDEGFSYIDDGIDISGFANLRYTVKRNIVRFYNQYLATCNLFSKKTIKNTEYTNNGDLELIYEGVQTIEDESFTPDNPILSPFMHEVIVITDFNSFIELRDKCKTDRGYIRVVDSLDHVLKIYPKELSFKNTSEYGELKIIGEEKYEPSLVNIVDTGLGYILINDYYRLVRLKYKYVNNKFYIFDEDERLLFNPLYWQKISVNGSLAETKEDLIQWLELLS